MKMREAISIFYPESKARLGELIVDAYISETHTFSSVMTEHPIENGSTIVDHIHHQPFCLSIEGIISNTPMTLIGLTAFDSAQRYLDGESTDFALIALEKIEDIFKKREPISIATSLKIYHKMVLDSLSVERGGGNEQLHLSCTAKQIRLVYQERIKVSEPQVSRARPKQKKGLQETKTLIQEKIEAIKKEKTWLKNLFGNTSLKPGNIN